MKFRISWPTGIVLVIGAFVIFILSFVYKVMFMPQYDHHLVSEDYYKEELHYQEEIDKMNNGLALKQNVTIEKTADGVLIVFPDEFNYENISGTIFFQRMSNSKIDFERAIALNSHRYLIKDKDLVEGRWDIKITWEVNGKDYLLKKKISY